MPNEEYFKNIYHIKNQIQTLDDVYYESESNVLDPIITAKYEAARQTLCDKLEAAYKA